MTTVVLASACVQFQKFNGNGLRYTTAERVLRQLDNPGGTSVAAPVHTAPYATLDGYNVQEARMQEQTNKANAEHGKTS